MSVAIHLERLVILNELSQSRLQFGSLTVHADYGRIHCSRNQAFELACGQKDPGLGMFVCCSIAQNLVNVFLGLKTAKAGFWADVGCAIQPGFARRKLKLKKKIYYK